MHGKEVGKTLKPSAPSEKKAVYKQTLINYRQKPEDLFLNLQRLFSDEIPEGLYLARELVPVLSPGSMWHDEAPYLHVSPEANEIQRPIELSQLVQPLSRRMLRLLGKMVENNKRLGSFGLNRCQYPHDILPPFIYTAVADLAGNRGRDIFVV